MAFKKIILTAVLAFCAAGLYAQSREALWMEYYPDFNIGRWRLTPEVSYRNVDFAGTHTVYFRPTATYRVNRYLSVAAALYYIASWDEGTVNKHEWGIYQNVAARTPSVAGFYFGLNTRMEQLFAHVAGQDGHTFGLRLRWSPRITYDLPFWTEKKLSVSLFCETYNFLTASQSGYFRNALDLGAGFGISPSERIDLALEFRRMQSYRTGADSYTNMFRIMLRHKIL